MAKLNKPLTLRHRRNVGEEAKEVAFAAGEGVEVLETWAHHYLCRNRDGFLFNIPREDVDVDD